MRILGIDPGLADIGYAVVDMPREGVYECASWHEIPAGRGSKIIMVSVPGYHVKTTTADDMPVRLQKIYDNTRGLIATYKPDAAAIEQYIGSVRSSMDSAKIGSAYGAIVCGVLACNMVPVVYLPNVVKKTVSGVGGRADKDDMMWAVEAIMEFDKPLAEYYGSTAKASHVGDAFAIAICHGAMAEASQ